MKGTTPASRRPRQSAPRGATAPLGDEDIEALRRLLDAVPSPLEPLDIASLDGFLCGVLVQPERVPKERWLGFVVDADGRAPPIGYDAAPLQALALRRHAELDAAIGRRQWFDPWVFEVEGGSEAADPGEAVMPWVAGVAAALELFPGLMRLPDEATAAPLALLYRHLDPDDLEDADEWLAEIEMLEPVVDLEDAVEGLVRATLLLADLTRPLR